MSRLISYLTFGGNCREAMTFYQKCLGGELRFQTLGESPMADQFPRKIKGCILHSSLHRYGWVLMGTDMVGEEGLIKGNAISLLIECSSENEMRNLYEMLSENGQSTHPIHTTFWGALFGGLTDKYGNGWLFHYQ
ncbi:VOC family protein [Catalinimonas niigatensis]|uniref:VOC family protein n=1 Tax=Catalinimonas niigatensis TaxID=1397264 RepID=UPI0026653ACA|nr:VOC family protein [Catalinimonas niigatensis]WPP50632.1 VOC family protein [Catalinimonas niigatensis]